MSLPSIDVNAVDPNGEEPPDELFYRPSEDIEVSLCRQSTLHGEQWRLAYYRDGNREDGATFSRFETAFSRFTSWIHTYRPDAKGARA